MPPPHGQHRRPRPGLLLATLAVAACGGGSGASGKAFAVVDVNVLEGQQWKINRPIEFTFNRDVDFSTVSFTTIRVVDSQGIGATGVFSQGRAADGSPLPRVVHFQPRCPLLEDNSDAGLRPGTAYSAAVMGTVNGSPAVHSADGEVLEHGKLVSFKTPEGDDPGELFQDTVPGPPAVRVRGLTGVGPDDLDATHVLIGGQPVWFALDPATQKGVLPPGFEVPLNHYSIPENEVVVAVLFDQPVSSAPGNIALVVLEYFDDVEWVPVQASVELAANCTETGATVLVSPLGILPQGRDLRIHVKAGFSDLTGDSLPSGLSHVALMDVVPAGGENPLFPGIDNPEADDVLEAFAHSGGLGGSLEDTQTAFPVPRASWGDGTLRASFGFDGTGGPGGDFDWYLPPATEIILDTSVDTIVGGPGGAPTTTQTVINGIVDVRDMLVPVSSRLIIVGPNTCTILASGQVTILGQVTIGGSDASSVIGINAANQPEPGAKGHGGGGDGGTGSYFTSQSTPQGGPGNGAFNAQAAGGQGGETSYVFNDKDGRRGAGGGGGRFGPDIRYDHDLDEGTPELRVQTLVGLDAEYGSMGGPTGTGAVSQSSRAVGGAIAKSPFLDEFDDNDFLGVMLTADGRLIQGELDGLWAGSGGGAGGDGVNSATFPLVPFDITGDEKGAGGAGGAGGLQILAIGPIQVGDSFLPGSLVAEGGNGNGGESIFDRVGGGSGGASGGHLVLSSAAEIVIHGRAASGLPWYHDDPKELEHDARPISVLGGQGGAGRANRGGTNELGTVSWQCDRIPFPYAEGFAADYPPFDQFCWTIFPDLDDPDGGPVVGSGGDGGPGILQLHVEDPTTQLLFPTIELEQGKTWSTGLDVSYTCAPPPVGWHRPDDPDGPDQMIPFFGKTSMAQSRWIPLGLARVTPAGGTDPVLLHAAAGEIPHDGSVVEQLPPLLGPDPLGAAGSPPYLEPDGYTIVFDSGGLAAEDQLFAENPNLLLACTVQLEDGDDPNDFERYRVTAATHDLAGGLLRCHVDPAGKPLTSFVPQGPVLASLVPQYVRVVTGGVLDSYPVDSAITVRWDATRVDPLEGGPDEAGAFGFTTDLDALSAQDWDFLRFQVEFDLDVDGGGVDLSAPRPGLDHLRLSFEF